MGNDASRPYLHVLTVADSSPCAAAGLEPFFDFIVSAEGRPMVSARFHFQQLRCSQRLS